MIGVLDWGVGGMFLALRLLRREPSIDLVYLSDTGCRPYGLLGRRALTARVRQAIGFLHDQGATRVVLACHSASTTASSLDVPIPVQCVIDASRVPSLAKDILYIGGERTVRSGIWGRALRERAPDARVRGRVAQPLSAWIERGLADDPACRSDLVHILRGRAPDTLVLACTHYAALNPILSEMLPGTRVVDPALGVADDLALASGAGRIAWWTTGQTEAMVQAARQVHGLEIQVRRGKL